MFSLCSRFKAYETTLPMNEAFESSLLAASTGMTCFCACTIKFLRKNPYCGFSEHSYMIGDSDFVTTVIQHKIWPEIEGDFKQTMT